MGPAYFVIALLGCGDGSTACAPVATLPPRFADQASCSAAVPGALAANTDFDFPTIVAECRAVKPPPAARKDQPRPLPAAARRG